MFIRFAYVLFDDIFHDPDMIMNISKTKESFLVVDVFNVD